MTSQRSLRTLASAALLAASALTAFAAPAQQPAPAARPAAAAASASPQDLTVLPPVPKTFQPKKTAWGDPDLRGIWPIDSLGGLPFQRTAAQGNRVFLTDEEFQEREKRMERSRGAAEAETKANKLGMGNWVEMTGAGRRTSLLVSPANGRLPEFTPYAKEMMAKGRSSWVKDQTYDWVGDFDSWDRCVTRGFPASMFPFRYNNGIQIFQAPGYVVINLEMIHDSRVIPIGNATPWPSQVNGFMGQSRGHWEGNTLVIETDHVIPGDSANPDGLKRAASPLNMATIGVPPNNVIPVSEQARTVERLTMTGPDSIVYELTYSDPKVWVEPWTARLDWQRNQQYGMFEYACHEGNVQVRNYISSSRTLRAQGKPQEKPENAQAQPAASN